MLAEAYRHLKFDIPLPKQGMRMLHLSLNSNAPDVDHVLPWKPSSCCVDYDSLIRQIWYSISKTGHARLSRN